MDPALAAIRCRLAKPGCEPGEDGFTLVEMLLTVLIFSIVAALTLTMVTSMLNDASAVNDTLGGLDQASTAGSSFTQYLRSISSVTGVNTVSGAVNSLQFVATVGTNNSKPCPTTGSPTTVPSAGVIVACTEDVTAALVTTASPLVDKLLVEFGPSGSTQRTVASFDIVPPGNTRAPASAIFQYYTLGGANGTTLVNEGATWAAANPTLIQGIGLDAAFLPPPGPGTEGFQAEFATVVHTIAFIRNPVATTTTTGS